MPNTVYNRKSYSNNRHHDKAQKKSDVVIDLPFGKSIVPTIIAFDPTPYSIQIGLVAITACSLAALPFVPLAATALGVPNSFDMIHGITNDFAGFRTISETILMPQEDLKFGAGVSGLFFLILFSVDVFSEFFPVIDWPKSFHTKNTQCYHEMFSESTRNSFVRRPGNTYSNIVYLFTGLCVLMSAWNATESRSFLVSDTIFGFMLTILALFSVIWHASNSPTSHYVDLWAMNSCIGYLVVRFLCMAIPSEFASHSCVVLYSCFVLYHGIKQYRDYRNGVLLGGCPFSARARLKNVNKAGNIPLTVGVACKFASMPVLYMILPYFVEFYVLNTNGSVYASSVCSLTLVIGWSWRLFERFGLDGFKPLNLIQTLRKKHDKKQNLTESIADTLVHRSGSFALTTASALLSPTAALHWFTGCTLLFGYLHARSVDMCV